MSPIEEILFPLCQKTHSSLLPAWRTVGCLAGWLVRGEDRPRGISTWSLSSFSFCYHQFLGLCRFSAIIMLLPCSPRHQPWFELLQFSYSVMTHSFAFSFQYFAVLSSLDIFAHMGLCLKTKQNKTNPFTLFLCTLKRKQRLVHISNLSSLTRKLFFLSKYLLLI